MSLFDALIRGWRFSVRRVLRVWTRVTVKPDGATLALQSRARPVCYVLERESRTDLGVLEDTCARLGFANPEARMTLGKQRCERSYFELMRRQRLLPSRASQGTPRLLTQIVAAATADPDIDIDFVPVAIYFGRAPQKEVSWWRLWFSEDWMLVGRFRKFLNVLVNGRHTVVYFGEPVRLRDTIQEGLSEPRSVRRLMRALRMELRAQRASIIGPDLSHRRTLVTQLLKTQAVRRAVRREMQIRADAAQRQPSRKAAKPGEQRRTALLVARKYALEIAANYSHPFITFMSFLLARVWNRLYDGVEFQNAEKLKEVGDNTEIIYVPCHRSHMDYLLLSYVIYHKGFAIPHVAAGINLNMPVVGRFLRMGGAFFLRRTFKGNVLYSAVFIKYLGFMMARGHPLEYFIEGGRSRTGRLLQPRSGMLSMTVRSFLRDPKRPVVFMPVYFGYERIVEGRTYIGELSGQAKEKESVFGLLKALSVLKSKFGKVHVNLGQPIALEALLDKHNPGWRHESAEDDNVARPGWISGAIADLSSSIVTGINAAAAVTPINLVAIAILATPRQALAEIDLQQQLEMYQRLLRLVPYSPLITVTPESGAEMIKYAESMGLLERQAHSMGDIMRMSPQNAVLATYYRNNILHLFAVPSLIACGFVSNVRMRTSDLQRLVWRVYPYICAELFLTWHEADVAQTVESLLDAFSTLGLLQANEDRSVWERPASTALQAYRLDLLAQATIQTLERYYLAIALLLQAGSGCITQEALEQRCHLVAQRMSVLYGLNSPEFFDKSLFRNFIELLRKRGVVQPSSTNLLVFGDALAGVASDAQLVLSEQIRHSILQVTLGR